MLIALLLVATTSAFAGGPPTNTHEVVNEQIPEWSLPDDGSCATTPNGMTGDGDRHQVINTRTNADGTVITTINDLVTGDAWDDTGTYHYVYTNHSVDVLPAGSDTHQVMVVDSFVLNGHGSVGHMNVGFNWSWTYSGEFWPPSTNWVQTSDHGDPLHCDPI